MKKLILNFFYFTLFISLIASPVFGIEVGGIINSDTVWSIENSPYTLNSAVQIPENVTLTINPGVEARGSSMIEVWGTLTAIGSQSSMIIFNSIFIKNKQASAITHIEFSQFYGGAPYTDRNDGTGDFTLKHSLLKDIREIRLRNSDIENNEFIYSNLSSAKIWVFGNNNLKYNKFINVNLSSAYSSTIEYNYFYQGMISVCGTGPIYHYNTFIFENNSTFVYGKGGSCGEPNTQSDFSNNYWNTTDTDIIDSVIYDSNDDLNQEGYIGYLPILSESHPDTPTAIQPTANAGQDQTVCSEAVLDGSNSVDIDGTLQIYNWVYQYRDNPAYNKETTGYISEVTDLEIGIYDVTLTVSDNNGLTDTDIMILTVDESECSNTYDEVSSDSEHEINSDSEKDSDSNSCFVSSL